MTRPRAPPLVDVDRKAVEQMLERAKAVLVSSDFDILKGLVDSFALLTELVRKRGTTIARLRRLFGLSGSERLADIVGEAEHVDPPAPDGGANATAPAGGEEKPPVAEEKDAGDGAGSGQAAGASKPDAGEGKPKEKVKGHGRVPASAYLAAHHIAVPHESLHAGDPCPDGCRGRLYGLHVPASLLRIFGQAPLASICWDCEQLRCGTCGKVCTARAPEQAQGPKYDETAASMIALLDYGTGMPFHRLDRLQRVLETPVPASTQWDVVNDRVKMVRPVYDELVRLAAQGSVVHNDDSHMRILELMGKRRAALLKKGELPDPERTGLFTTAIVSIDPARPPIALFFTGRKHAGENLGDVLEKRSADLPPPIQMGDALTRNVPERRAVIESNCLAHGRRKIVDEVDNYPTECRDLLKKLSRVYKLDEDCREKKLSAQQRLEAHRRDSAPVMDEIRRWMVAQFADKRIEPNSGLGEAFNYLLKRWDKFTLFLRVPGAPLDNNICERALKMAIKHRNGSLFYRSQRGATVGDTYMTLIHTTELHKGNPFDYLTALQRHAKAVAEKPAEWLPWTYKTTLARMGVNEVAHPSSRPAAATSRAPPSPVVTRPWAA
jgi:transposase